MKVFRGPFFRRNSTVFHFRSFSVKNYLWTRFDWRTSLLTSTVLLVPLAIYLYKKNKKNETKVDPMFSFNEVKQQQELLLKQQQMMLTQQQEFIRQQVLHQQEELKKQKKQDEKPPIYRIVLTGGPCGGKSTALSLVSDRLQSLGFRVFRVPEAATLLITGGGLSPNAGEAERISFEGNLIRIKFALEDTFYEIAKASGEPSVIICDRGTMDTSAYLSKELWDIVLDEFNWNVVDLRDKRYDAVIHMVTAAIGAEKFYTTENNAARSEGLEKARELDFKVLNAWVGHPRIRIIDNSTGFAEKVQRVNNVICEVVGAPQPTDRVRKFVLESIDLQLVDLPIKFESFEVEQTYLAKPESVSGYTYVRRRGQNGVYTYTHSTVRNAGEEDSEKNIILERTISGREYVALLKQADPSRSVVRKKVHCFMWKDIYYELQTWETPNISLTILNTEIETDKEISLPSFIKVKSEVTGVEEFSSYYIAGKFKDRFIQSWEEDENMFSKLMFNNRP
eukprot:TRINITY_DN155_c0_g3_i2.p2 TRINITY_DN155_c0_g3~~TRINITY_DN155_c0_g3_i2.p2  ORF type:complete len:507 (-),score=104.28 TRINITY_DN155_c0_g3_i2:707-2227(-)